VIARRGAGVAAEVTGTPIATLVDGDLRLHVWRRPLGRWARQPQPRRARHTRMVRRRGRVAARVGAPGLLATPRRRARPTW